MIKNVKNTFYWVLGVTILGCSTPSLVKAQHIVTESEAGKLTLASLTAAPIVHHYRPVKRTVRKSRHPMLRNVAYHTSSKKSYSSLVHKISYRQKNLGKMRVRNALYNVSSHKKSKARRHRS